MDPATIALLGQLANLAFSVVDGAIKVNTALNTEDAAEVERLLGEASTRRNAIADELRETPPDRED